MFYAVVNFKIVELDFSWPSFNSGLYWAALGLYSITVAGKLMIWHYSCHDSALFYILIFNYVK